MADRGSAIVGHSTVSLVGETRPLADWLTTFPLVAVVLDPFTHESAWILDDARRFLGTYADEFLTFTDPDLEVIRGIGIGATPAFALLRHDGTISAKAEGWSPQSWRKVAEAIVALTRWSRPMIPDAGDPAEFTGHPVGS